jgi:hypothetical protein
MKSLLILKLASILLCISSATFHLGSSTHALIEKVTVVSDGANNLNLEDTI